MHEVTRIKPTILYQEVITKGIFRQDYSSIVFEKAADISCGFYDKVIVFCSLQNARFIERHKLPCYNGLFYNEKFLHYNLYSQYVPKGFLLNDNYIIVPWGNLVERIDDIIRLFGENIFIRPNSPTKPFTGFSKSGKTDLLFEIHALTQTDKVYPHELCIVASAKKLSEIEWRFWLIDEKISTWAPYSWNADFLTQHKLEKPPTKMQEMAGELAERLIEHDNAIVADFVETSEGVKLVELNAVSTSGWYEGMNYQNLITDLSML